MPVSTCVAFFVVLLEDEKKISRDNNHPKRRLRDIPESRVPFHMSLTVLERVARLAQRLARVFEDSTAYILSLSLLSEQCYFEVHWGREWFRFQPRVCGTGLARIKFFNVPPLWARKSSQTSLSMLNHFGADSNSERS